MNKRTRQNTSIIPYAPKTWTPEQAQMHQAKNLDEAFHAASCLAGGWYRRQVTIYIAVIDGDEEYQILPSDVPQINASFRPAYRVERVEDN